MDRQSVVVFTVVFSFLAMCLGFIIGCEYTADRYKTQAIEHGAAQFNITTGAWEWK